MLQHHSTKKANMCKQQKYNVRAFEADIYTRQEVILWQNIYEKKEFSEDDKCGVKVKEIASQISENEVMSTRSKSYAASMPIR